MRRYQWTGSLLPYLEQENLQDLTAPNIPWFLLPSSIARQQVGVFECPSDTSPNPTTYPLIGMSSSSWSKPIIQARIDSEWVSPRELDA